MGERGRARDPPRGADKQIAVAFPNGYLVDSTIEENIRLGAAVREAATAARLDEVIERLPGGRTTNVGEGGALLSGGVLSLSLDRAGIAEDPIAPIGASGTNLLTCLMRAFTNGRPRQ